MSQNNYYFNLQNNLNNSNAPSPSSNLDFSHNNNSRSNSYKRVMKPNSHNNNSINSTLNKTKFDALSRDTRSNTYHFGNSNNGNNANSRGNEFNSYLNIYDDDEEEDEDINNFLNNNSGNSNLNFNQQFMDSQQIKFANFNNENNDNNGFKMKLDSIQDNRANTISKQYNNTTSSFDNVLLNDTNNIATSYMDFLSPDNNAINTVSDSFDTSKNFMKLSDGDILNNFGISNGNTGYGNNIKPPVKVEESPASSLSNGASANMNKIDTNNSNSSSLMVPAYKKNSNDGKKKKPKMSHNIIEQKYRDNINEKILQFKHIVPSLQICCLREDYLKDYYPKDVEEASDSNYLDGLVSDPKLLKRLDGLEPAKKLSKAIILSKSYEYIEHMEQKVEQLEEKLMRYEQLIKSENSNANVRQNNNEDKFMHTPLSSLNQMNVNNSMSKSSSSGSYYMPDHKIYNNHIPKPPQDIKGPSHALYQNSINMNSQNMQTTNSEQIRLNKQGTNVTSQSLSNINSQSSSSMQSSNQYENFDNVIGYNMKTENSGTKVTDNNGVVDFGRLQSPLINMETNNSDSGSLLKKNNSDGLNNKFSYLGT
ncbi:hypothetical protein FOG51_02860 [Hanseniaspora uvarum]|nr:hypothetical protein FOG51_02860 [Hanseniaspora uvarum]